MPGPVPNPLLPSADLYFSSIPPNHTFLQPYLCLTAESIFCDSPCTISARNMPRTPEAKLTPKSESSSEDKKPYIHPRASTPRPSPSTPTRHTSDEDATVDTPTKSAKRGGHAKAWSAEDLISLFDVVAKSGASGKGFDGAVDGRTGAQCYSTWK